MNTALSVDRFSADYLRSRFVYEPETGRLFWRKVPERNQYYRAWNKTFSGREAFTRLSSTGYRVGGLGGIKLNAHQVIYKIMTGYSAPVIDHVNRDKTDNRWVNLRAVSQRENVFNSTRFFEKRASTDLPLGVFRHRDRYRARASHLGKRVNLGTYMTVSEAGEAYQRFLASLQSAPTPFHVPPFHEAPYAG